MPRRHVLPYATIPTPYGTRWRPWVRVTFSVLKWILFIPLLILGGLVLLSRLLTLRRY
jgi:hypothetical protein